MPYINQRVTIHFPTRTVEVDTPTLEFVCPRCEYTDVELRGIHHKQELLSDRKNKERVSSFNCPKCRLSIVVYGEGDDAIMEAEFV